MTRELTSLYSLVVEGLEIYDTYGLFIIPAVPSPPRARCTIHIFTNPKTSLEVHSHENGVNESEGNESDVKPHLSRVLST